MQTEEEQYWTFYFDVPWASVAIHILPIESSFLAPVYSYGHFYLDTGKTLIPTANQGQWIAVFGAN